MKWSIGTQRPRAERREVDVEEAAVAGAQACDEVGWRLDDVPDLLVEPVVVRTGLFEDCCGGGLCQLHVPALDRAERHGGRREVQSVHSVRGLRRVDPCRAERPLQEAVGGRNQAGCIETVGASDFVHLADHDRGATEIKSVTTPGFVTVEAESARERVVDFHPGVVEPVCGRGRDGTSCLGFER
jgi:hypothetical protein